MKYKVFKHDIKENLFSENLIKTAQEKICDFVNQNKNIKVITITTTNLAHGGTNTIMTLFYEER